MGYVITPITYNLIIRQYDLGSFVDHFGATNAVLKPANMVVI
uniref:Uncharacterized protein n=1 Tax=Rhizophora mucronata TaxID=61149 RepID=A0A2P2LZ30_RHIMU